MSIPNELEYDAATEKAKFRVKKSKSKPCKNNK